MAWRCILLYTTSANQLNYDQFSRLFYVSFIFFFETMIVCLFVSQIVCLSICPTGSGRTTEEGSLLIIDRLQSFYFPFIHINCFDLNVRSTNNSQEFVTI